MKIYLDDLRTAPDAAHAYDSAALKYFGEFARINTYEAQDE